MTKENCKSVTLNRRNIIRLVGSAGVGFTLTSGLAGAQSEEVDLTIDNFEPSSIDDDDDTHELTFRLENVSSDGNDDTITITLPDCIEIESASFKNKGPFDPQPDPLEAKNPIEFSIDPEEPIDDPVQMSINLKLSPTSSCGGEDDDSTDDSGDDDVSDPAGCPELPLSFTTKTFEFTEFEEFTDFPPLSVEVPSEYAELAGGSQATLSQRIIGIKFPDAFFDRSDFEVQLQITAGFFDTVDEVVDFNDYDQFPEVTDEYDRNDNARIFDDTNANNTIIVVYKSTTGVDKARVDMVPTELDYFEAADCPNGVKSVRDKAVNTIGPAE